MGPSSLGSMDVGSLGITYWVMASTGLHVASFLAIVLHALKRRRNASATILWIFVAWSLPVIGPLCYLAFGIDRVPSKGLVRRAANQAMLTHRRQRDADSSSFSVRHLRFHTRREELEGTLVHALSHSLDAFLPDHLMLSGNVVVPLVSGDEAYPLMLESIRNARHHIHLQSFIIHRDSVGKMFLEALAAKAREGVKVRLLFDRFGSTHAHFGGMFRMYRHIPNLEIQGWTQANPLKRQFQVNLRNHRKSLIVDGHLAFFGGINIANENVCSKRGPAIRDYHFRVEGPLVHELQYTFLSDWYFMTEQSPDVLLCQEHFPEMLSTGPVRARIIDSGPSAHPGLPGEAFFNAITMAQHQILITTPYFVPPRDILRAVMAAARRGVDVRLIVPEKNNHRYAGLASRALYEELLEAGVQIYQRKPPFIHAKSMVIDDAVALVGTANLDVRSLELNYETTILFEEPQAVARMKQLAHEEMEQSSEITLNEWLQRSPSQKLGENLCALMTPVL